VYAWGLGQRSNKHETVHFRYGGFERFLHFVSTNALLAPFLIEEELPLVLVLASNACVYTNTYRQAMSLYPQTRKTINFPFRRLMVFCLLKLPPQALARAKHSG